MKKLLLNLFKLLFINLFIITLTYAKVPVKIIKYKKQEEEKQEKKIDIENLKKFKNEFGKDLLNNEDKINNIENNLLKDIDKSTECDIKFKHITATNNTIYSNKYLTKAIFNKYINKCINKTNLDLIQNEIMLLYIKNGYSNARVYFDIKDKNGIKNGKFNFIIEEGRIKEITINDNKSFKNRVQLFFAFPFLKDKVFNLKDYEQGLYQINRLSSNKATMDIAGLDSTNDLYSYSNIKINNKQSFPVKFNLLLDNSGGISTGENKITLKINFDNLLFLNDNTNIKYSQNLNTKNNTMLEKTFCSNISIPFGYWTFSNTLNYSTYLNTTKTDISTITVDGVKYKQTYTIDRSLYSTNLFKINLGTELNISNNRNYILGIKNRTSSRKVSDLSVYINTTIYNKFGNFIIKPSYQKGLSCFNSTADFKVPLKVNFDPTIEYNIFKFYFYYNTKLNIPSFDKKFNVNNSQLQDKLKIDYTFTFDSQYSFDSLYSNNKISIGGESTIRGFKNNIASGDYGFYIRNDMSLKMQDLLPKVFSNIVKNTDIILFYDFGYVKNKKDIDVGIFNLHNGYMSGAGITFKNKYDNFNWSLTFAKGFSYPTYLKNINNFKEENGVIYFKIEGTF